MAESSSMCSIKNSVELSKLEPKSTGCDYNNFEEMQGEEVEQAKRDATADSTGILIGRFLFRGVTGAVASLGAFGQKNGPKGATKIKEPQSHRQTTAENRTGPQLHGEADPLDVAFQHSAELQQKNAELTKRLSTLEKEKKLEINDLTTHLKELQRAVTVLNRDVEKKDKKIVEMKTLVQKLSDKKRDGSLELARALHKKDTKIETLTQLLQTEKGKLRVTSTELQEALREKETQIADLENQLKEYEAKVLEMEQVRDHSKSQSKAMLVVKQELDATKMSHDDLVQYIGSMERQVADTETHCRKLEAQLNGAREDYNIAQQAFRDTREGLEAELESVRETHSKLSTTNSSLEAQLFQAQEKIDNLSVEKEAFVQERAVLKQEFVELHDKLGFATAEAELYKEDFENERKDREKAHDLKEEMRFACDEKVHAMAKEQHALFETIQNLTRKIKEISNKKKRVQTNMSKSEAHDELLKVQLDNHSLCDDNEKLNRSLQEVQEQFARLKVRHLELKKEVTIATPTTPSTEPIHLNQVSVIQDTPQGRNSDSSDPTAIPRPDPSNKYSIAQQLPTMPSVNIVPRETQDNYNPQPEARLVPNSPTEGLPSMNFDEPRSAHDRVEVNGFRNAAERNERQSCTGPQPDNSIRYPPGLKVKQSRSSAPSSTNLALPEQAASPTDALKMSLVLGDQQLERPSNMPSDFNQSHYPANNTHQGGGYQDPVNNSQWPNQQPYLQDHYYQQQTVQPGPPQYEQPRSPHYNPQQQNYGPSNDQQQSPHWCNHGQQYPNSQRESNQQYQGARQQAYNYPNDGLQPQQYNTITPSYPSNFRDDDAHSPVLNNHNSLSENASNPIPSNISSRPSINGYGVDMSPEKPKPKPRAHCKPDTPSPVSNPETQKQLNPNRTELLVKPNGLQDGIDREISEVAAAVSQVTRKEGERDGAPLDPNLVCPMCMKQYRIGEIQLYRAHVNKCDGTRH